MLLYSAAWAARMTAHQQTRGSVTATADLVAEHVGEICCARQLADSVLSWHPGCRWPSLAWRNGHSSTSIHTG